MQSSEIQEFLLPTNDDDLKKFINEIVEEFSLPPGRDTSDMIATMILHLPTAKAYAPKEYFGHGVLKSMANQAAFKMLEAFRKEREAEEAAKKDAGSNVEPIQNETV